ncbi:MAG: 3-phosphoshikimate 1-carboxyvinyltransferase [Planctomycetes bacterium]|nr:3-phosphoshikimate 1-carboxyvinyltransferase [Planctomycetota bacterium]
MSIAPKGALDARVRVPGSKSLTARALVAAGLAAGRSVLDGALRCEDTEHLAGALEALGLRAEFSGEGIRVDGGGGRFPRAEADLSLGNAGTAMRFMTAVLAAAGGRYRLDGTARMRERPIGELVDALRALGANVACHEGFPPVETGPGGLSGGRIRVAGETSSQFVTGLLMAAPLARGPVEIAIAGRGVSRPYLDLTESVLEAFGIAFDKPAPETWCIAPGRYRARTYAIEGDASSASYLLGAAAIAGGRVRVEGLGRDTRQGDARFLDCIEAMGCRVARGADHLEAEGPVARGIEVDAGEIPDVVPTIAAVALFAEGATSIRNVGHLRHKESDRIASVASEMRKLGGRVDELPDGLRIEPGRLRGATIDPWGDHRIAMSCAIAGLRVPGVAIRDPRVVEKSFPDFFDVLRDLEERR